VKPSVAFSLDWRRAWRWALFGALGLLLALGVWRSLPSPLFDTPLSAVLVARDGSLLGARIAEDGQWRFPPAAEVPAKYRAALLAYEDRCFDWHPGVDPLAVARAVRLNLKHGRVVSGGSTLSMQVVRMARGERTRDWRDKLIETLLALRIELQYSKDAIVVLHASHAPFGGNVVGLEAAAWRYFGRAPQALSWAEASTLAVLPNSPALIHPGRSRGQLQAKRDRLLQRLHDDGHLSALDLELALHEPLVQEPRALPQLAPHLLSTLQARSPGQFRFVSTLDVRVQSVTQALVQSRAQELRRQHIHNAAALVVDNHSFEVVAYVGNSEWSVANERGHAVDIVQRPRSTGSILKPFLYAAMLDAGEILPRTLVPDIPTQYGGFTPENADHAHRGAVPAEVALAQSLNVPAVRMLKQHGVERFHGFLQDLGLTTLHRSPGDYGLTLILGGAEAKLFEVVALYAQLAHRAAAPPAGHSLRSLRLLAPEPEARPTAAPALRAPAALSPGAAYLSLQALLEVARPGDEGHWKNFAHSRKIAWKTGTSWGLRDAWAVGVTPRYTVGVWVGNASGEGRPGLSGAAAAAPLLFDIVNPLDSGGWFAPPYAWLKQLAVCANDGHLATGDCETSTSWAPAGSHFDQASPHNIRIHLDLSGKHRVHGGCESVAQMRHRSWFVLPPAMEHFYRQHHSGYQTLPNHRPDCTPPEAARGTKGPIDILYPEPGAKIYIPMDLAEVKGRVVLEAVHRNPLATLHWHLNGIYLGTTQTFHQRALDAAAGQHLLTLVDQDGTRISLPFEVIGQGQR